LRWLEKKSAHTFGVLFCTQDGEKGLDLIYFRELALDFYLSDNASDLGNFINGQLKYD